MNYKLKEYYVFNQEDLESRIKGLDKFNINEINDKYGYVDYYSLVFDIRAELEYIESFIIEMQEYKRYNNKSLYSRNDIPLLKGYIKYIQELLKISNSLLYQIHPIKSKYLDECCKKMQRCKMQSKKEAIAILIEVQSHIIERYNDLLYEVFAIMEV